MFRKSRYINVKGRLIDLQRPKIMGVINVTPDSFYSGSCRKDEKEILETARKMLSEGADFIDVGGYSSRPGADIITIEEEKKRVLPAIRIISGLFPDAVISVDTFRAEVAYEAITLCGAHIINDISGGELDKEMFSLVKQLKVPYIIMHMKGTPANMQINPVYEDVVAEILMWMGEKIVTLQSAGVNDIIVDPGIGFGKTAEHNFEILRRLKEFSITGLPVLVGVSRKSVIWKTLGITPDEALNGTTVLNTIALLNGADIIRVHDVKEAVQTRELVLRVMEEEKIVLL
ncbi:MAG TPA: dihydropteroate synthase [Bacteroidales bacterium]|nr:dihydropteroate synthase [Bacteroidales bacterium]HRC90103.1 dihydropteroate synthase [Bacteroidales bacterium]